MPTKQQTRARIVLAICMAITFAAFALADILIDSYTVRIVLAAMPLVVMLVLLGEQVITPWGSAGGDDE